MKTKKEWLDYLFYKIGKQIYNFELTCLSKEGAKSKWVKYLQAQSDEKFLEKANNRTILSCEVVIDIEEKEKFSEISEKIKQDFKFYSIYETGSRGFHIHLFFDDELTSEEKRGIIEKYGGDIQKASNRCMIALENCPHYKTGKIKKLIEEKEGFNSLVLVRILKEEKEEELKKERIKSFLQEDRQKYESLGCGYHNGVYYFGTKLFREGKPYTAIVTSDKKIYIKVERLNEIRDIFGLNYKDDFYDEGLDNILSREAVDKWLYENIDDITLKSIFDKLIEIFKKYVYFEDERKYSLLACYRIAGFFMPIWRARARLFIYAEMGSAKSRLTNILHNTGFNSVALGDWTLAYLQRLIESTRGETHIDDFETLPEDLKNATNRLVKVGYMKGFKAGKISDGKIRKPETYDLFNTTTLNNITGLDFVTTDRCITIRIPKISKKEYDLKPNFKEKIWQELRNELYILGLKYAKQVAETYEILKSDKIRGRLLDIIEPELTIAKLISEKVFQDIENFWIEETEQRENIDYETDWEFLAMKQIYKILSTLSTNPTLSTHSTLSTSGYFVLLDDVVKPIGLELYEQEEFKKKKRSMSIIIGNSLKRSPIFKKRVVKGKTQFKVDFEELKSLLEAKGFLKPILDILEVDKVESVERGSEEMGKSIDKELNIKTEKIS
jgi:hypothetical protein